LTRVLRGQRRLRIDTAKRVAEKMLLQAFEGQVFLDSVVKNKERRKRLKLVVPSRGISAIEPFHT
jgi:hypothetical protein